MAPRNPFRARHLSMVGIILLTGACGGSSSSPTEPSPPSSPAGSASFGVVGAGADRDVSWGSGSNLIFCRRQAGWADLWIRFAEQRANNGNNGPHLDIDLCALGDGGSFVPMDPQAASCAGGKTWGVWWHESTDTFVNRATSQPCSLEITRQGDRLSGSFQCHGLGELGGGRALDVLNGTFECSLE